MNKTERIKAFFNEDVRYIAHRFGYKTSKLPENSFEALKYLFNDQTHLDKLSGFEFDINITKDRQLVVVHDSNLKKLSNSLKDIHELTLEQFRDIDFTYREGDENKCEGLFKAPLLTEVLDFFKDNIDKLDNKVIRIESKGDEYFDEDLIKEFVKVILEYPTLHQYIEHITFMDEYVTEFNELRRKYKIKVANEKLFWTNWDAPVKQNDVFELVGMDFDNQYLTNDFVKDWSHISFYTVNCEDDILKLLSIVDVEAFHGKTIYLTTDDYTVLEEIKKKYCNK